MTKHVEYYKQQSRQQAIVTLEKINGLLFWISLEIRTNFNLKEKSFPDICEAHLSHILWRDDMYGMIHFDSIRIDVESPIIGKTPEDVLARLNDILIVQRMSIDVYQRGDRVLPVQAMQEIGQYKFSPKDGDKFIRCGDSLIQQAI